MTAPGLRYPPRMLRQSLGSARTPILTLTFGMRAGLPPRGLWMLQ
jgi:hypothetical protein